MMHLSENKPPKKPGFYYGYTIVLITFIMMVLGWGVFYLYGVFFTALTKEFGWNRAVTSGAFSVSLLISGLAGILAGRFSDRLGPKIVIISCTILMSLGYALMSLVHNIWQLYLIYAILIATGIGGFWSPLVSTVARWFTGRRGMMTGIVSGGISFGTLVLPPLAVQLISIYGWRTTYLIIGAVILVVVLIAVQFLKKSPQQMALSPYADFTDGPRTGQSVRGFSLKEAISTRQFWMVSIIYVCFGAVQPTIMVHIVPHATGLGISDMGAAVILSIIGGVSLTGRIIMGTITDRLRIKPSTVLCLGLLIVSLIWLQFSDSLWRLYLFAVIFGFGYGGVSCLQSLIAAELYGLLAIGVITAIFSFGFDIGGAVGPVMAGYIFDMSESYRWAFLFCLAAAAIALIIGLTLKPTRKPR